MLFTESAPEQLDIADRYVSGALGSAANDSYMKNEMNEGLKK